jgi:ferrochelatase
MSECLSWQRAAVRVATRSSGRIVRLPSAFGISSGYACANMTHPGAEGVLLVAHGTVGNLDEMVDFLTAIRRGRAPSPELVDEMCRRYSAIGGSPLLATTQRQADALSELVHLPVLTGMRFGRPSIEDALLEAVRRQLKRLIVVPMAPYSVSLYFGEVRAKRWAMPTNSTGSELELLSVPPWGTHAALIRAHADQIRRCAGERLQQGARLVLSAHSLPMRTIEIGDQYAREVTESAAAVGRALGVPVDLAFQSQGADGGRWLGPNLTDVVRAHAQRGDSEIVVAPFGFLCDHVETLFDLDIELKSVTDGLGVKLLRVPALGVDELLIAALAQLVTEVRQTAARGVVAADSSVEVKSC